jgi:hypothetical protein
MIAPTILALVAAPVWSFNGGAELVKDKGRESARIWHVDVYDVGSPQPQIGTLEFKTILAAHAGQTLKVCVRSHATKRGALVVYIPRADDEDGVIEIPTKVGTRYRTRCAEFTVVANPKSRPGTVQVANDGVIARVDYIRNVSIREVS